MAGLPHWANSRAATQFYEPVFQNQFEVIITPPRSIAGAEGLDILVEHVLSVDGLPEILPTVVEQKYKFATRSYSGARPENTVADLTVVFTVNLNEENNMYVYNILRGWADISYNPLNGQQGLKRDYYGQMAVTVSNKAQEVFRTYTFTPVIFNGPLNAIKLGYSEANLYEITAKFRADNWKDSRIGAL